MKSYKSAKEWHLYIKFENNHTIWTNTKPLTGKIFLCTIFCRISEAFCEHVHCQLLQTFRDSQVRVQSMHLFKALYLEKNSLHHNMVFSCLLKKYGPNLQNDTKLEMTSCFKAEKMAVDETLFCTGRLCEVF